MLVALAHAVLLHRDGIEGQDLAARLERASQVGWLPVCRSLSDFLACAASSCQAIDIRQTAMFRAPCIRVILHDAAG